MVKDARATHGKGDSNKRSRVIEGARIQRLLGYFPTEKVESRLMAKRASVKVLESQKDIFSRFRNNHRSSIDFQDLFQPC